MRSIKWQWLVERNAGLIVLSGAESGVDRPGARGRRRPARAGAGGAGAAGLRQPLLHRGAAQRHAGLRVASARRGAAGVGAAPAGGGDARRAVPRPRRPHRARCPRLRRRGRDAGQSEAGQALQPRAVLQDPGADGGAVRRPAERARQQRRDRQALQPRPGARQAAAARLRDAAGRRCAGADGRVLPDRLARRPRGPPRPALSRPGGARARAPALRRPGSTSRSRRS